MGFYVGRKSVSKGCRLCDCFSKKIGSRQISSAHSGHVVNIGWIARRNHTANRKPGLDAANPANSVEDTRGCRAPVLPRLAQGREGSKSESCLKVCSMIDCIIQWQSSN